MRGMIGESTQHKGVSLSWYFCQETSNAADFRRQIEDLSEFDGVIFSGCGMEEHKKELLRRDIPGVVICPKLLYKREIFPVIDYDRWSIFPDYCRILAEKYSNRPVVLINRPAAPCDEIESARINAFFTEGFENLGIDVEKVSLTQADCQDFHRLLEQLKAHQAQLHLDCAPLLLALSRVLLPPLCALIRESNSQAVPAGFIGGSTIEQLHAGIPHWQEPFFDMGRTAVSMLTEHLRKKTVLQDKILSMTYRDV
jgi:DNA-binding LacI/PurR family transcriptional regulator